MTSFDVCHRVQKILKADKVGHTGTLDPNTTGVLVLGVNQATKLMPLLVEHDKEYQTTILFGILTDTLDITGRVLEEQEVSITNEMVDQGLAFMSTQTMQVPPMYSSIKINGKKLYEYARKKETIEVPAREVKLYECYRTSDVYLQNGKYACDVYLKTSKGFYVRSLIRDLAEHLGTVATMLELNRISSGDFHLKQSYTLDDLRNNEFQLLSIENVFSHLPKINVSPYLAKLVQNGVVLDERQISIDSPFLVYHDTELLAVYAPYQPLKYKAILILRK